MKKTLPVLAACLIAACSPDDDGYVPWDGLADIGDSGWETVGDTIPDLPGEGVDTWGMDIDGDGWTPADGDCDDTQYSVNPGAYDDPDNDRDDDCDGTRDNPVVDCDCGSLPTLVDALDICDTRFVRGVTERGGFDPATAEGRGVRSHYGDSSNGLGVRAGCAYSLLDTGRIEPTTGGRGDPDRQIGTDFRNPGDEPFGPWCHMELSSPEPDPDPTGGTGIFICDTQQLEIQFTAPTNAVGFSFDFVYVSSEYPEWVGEGYNDTFYAILDRPSTGERINISFDDYGAEIEVDNAFFEDPPVTNLAGTGYSDTCTNEDFSVTICGSSTGWLRTSWEIEPREEFTLTFSIHDEGDGRYDSVVILDNFLWSLDAVTPGTVLI